jgi:hypothetical protein
MLELLLPLIFTIVCPLLTEGVKKLGKFMKHEIPTQLVPVVSTGFGVVGAMLFPDLGMTETMGAVAGLSGTGLHQIKTARKRTMTP